MDNTPLLTLLAWVFAYGQEIERVAASTASCVEQLARLSSENRQVGNERGDRKFANLTESWVR
jgi:hypothetical protein